MIRTFIAMRGVDVGFDPDRMLTMRVPLADKRYPSPGRRAAFFQELLSRVGELPGVAAVGLNTGGHPLGNWSMPVEIPGNPQEGTRRVLLHQVNPGYLRSLNIGLVGGRIITESETAGLRHLALVNQAFERTYSPERNVLGRVVRVPRLRAAPFNLADDAFEIVGVVQDRVNQDLEPVAAPELYVPFTITGTASWLFVRTSGEAAPLIPSIRKLVYAVDLNQPVMDLMTMERVLAQRVLAGPRFNLVLFGTFASLGLVLALIGVYGVISHGVSQQTQEIGLRIALGAEFGDIAGMVLKRGLVLLLLGILLGLAGSAVSVKLLASQLVNVSPFDPASFLAVSGILLLAGLHACLLPARRAARVDPMTALRHI